MASNAQLIEVLGIELASLMIMRDRLLNCLHTLIVKMDQTLYYDGVKQKRAEEDPMCWC